MEIILKFFTFEINVLLYTASFLITSVTLFITIRSLNRLTPRHHTATLVILTCILFITNILIGSYIATQLTRVPEIIRTSPESGGTLDMHKPLLTVTFATPVNFNTLRVYSYPETQLTVIPAGYINNHMSFGRSLSIVPQTTYPGGEPVLIFFSNIEGPLTHGYGGERLLEIMASDLPKVEQIASETPLSSVSPDTAFTATLDSPNQISSHWYVTTSPPHPLSVETLTDKTLSIRPDKPLTQGTTYTMTLYQEPSVYRFSDGEILRKLPSRPESVITFTTVNPPFIHEFTPTGTSINPGDELTFVFDESMNTAQIEKMITTIPDFKKTFVWESEGKVLHIRHDRLASDTAYIITLPKGTLTAKGGVLETDAVFQFKTAGPVTLTESSPARDASDISVQSKAQITFDQDITETLARTFSIDPPVKGKITIHKNTALFTPDKPLAYNTQYTIQFSAGIQSVYGLPSSAVQSISFTTEPQQIALAVPYYRQQSAFTCNIASARMLLAFRGITTDEDTLIQMIGSSGTRGNGNPYKGYVSDYGTYWDAVIKGIVGLRPYRLITNGKLTDVINELAHGNPLMIWGQNGWSDPHDISWTASDGTYIHAINGMHSAVVRGFRGPQQNPTHILLNDPWRGQYSITVDEFMRRWGYFSVALIVE